MIEPQAPHTDMIRAAGAVVWRGRDSNLKAADLKVADLEGADLEVALVHRPRYDDWAFAKGKVKPGEHVVVAALREVAEETGLEVVLGRALPPIHYLKGDRIKRVDYWVARAVGAVAGGGAPLDDGEVDQVVWLSPEEAGQQLSYERDAELLRAVTAVMSPATTPLIFVRHATAGSREDWDGDDDDRPLDPSGEAQAETLAAILSGYRPTTLVTSPSARCTRTLEPYATRHGVGIRQEASLSETAHDPDAALRVVLELVDAGEPSVICSHGKVLPDLIAGVCQSRGHGLPADTELHKGELAVLHHTTNRIVSIERYLT